MNEAEKQFKKKTLLGLSEEGFHRISYMEWGENNADSNPIICLHGLTRNAHDFDLLAEFLSANGRHVYCPDIVGRGDSDWLKNPMLYTYEQYLADLNAFLARTSAIHFDWIGTSMGGLLGMFLASLPNSPIRRLILNDVGAQIPTQALARMAKVVGFDPDFRSFEEAKTYYKALYQDFGDLSEEDWDRITRNQIREVSPGIYRSKVDRGIKSMPAKSAIAWKAILHPIKALEGSLYDVDLWNIWGKITCPVLLIHGEKSDILLPSIIRKMQQTHPTMDIIEVPNTGHAPMLFDQKIQYGIYDWLRKTV